MKIHLTFHIKSRCYIHNMKKKSKKHRSFNGISWFFTISREAKKNFAFCYRYTNTVFRVTVSTAGRSAANYKGNWILQIAYFADFRF